LDRRQSPAEREAAKAKDSARNYWKRKVAEEEVQAPEKAPHSKADVAAQKSADQYWEREVADEQTRRGTPEPQDKP
ncbi:MAG: hypothetical protein O2919_07035, partial [Chloroflexi bacterium]|nr:hypothetical protein [Chloroflexota bacterium]